MRREEIESKISRAIELDSLILSISKELQEKGHIDPKITKSGAISVGRNAFLIENTIEFLKGRKEEAEFAEIWSNCSHLHEEATSIRWSVAIKFRPIAISIAKKYSAKHNTSLSVEDLIQFGMIGLLEATKRFDPKKKILFSTYARHWVRARISRSSVELGEEVPLSGDGNMIRIRAFKAKEKLIEAGISPTSKNIAAEIGASESRVKNVMLTGRPLSMDAPLGGESWEDGLKIGDGISAEENPEEDEMGKRSLLLAIKELSSKEREVVKERFGIDREETKTLNEIAKKMGLSRERVRQIEINAMKKLKESILIEPIAVNPRAFFRARTRLGMNQTEFGKSMGIDQTTISRIERKGVASVQTLEKIANWSKKNDAEIYKEVTKALEGAANKAEKEKNTSARSASIVEPEVTAELQIDAQGLISTEVQVDPKDNEMKSGAVEMTEGIKTESTSAEADIVGGRASEAISRMLERLGIPGGPLEWRMGYVAGKFEKIAKDPPSRGDSCEDDAIKKTADWLGAPAGPIEWRMGWICGAMDARGL